MIPVLVRTRIETPIMCKYAGVLPWARTLDGPVFLLGKELDGTWSDFGGSIEAGEKPLDAAVREAWEESMAFFGTPEDILPLLESELSVSNPTGVVYALEIPYDPEFPKIFKRVHDYHRISTLKYIQTYNTVTDTGSRTVVTSTGRTFTVTSGADKADGYLDKTEVDWFTPDEFIKFRKNVRRIARTTLGTLINKVLVHLLVSEDTGVYACPNPVVPQEIECYHEGFPTGRQLLISTIS